MKRFVINIIIFSLLMLLGLGLCEWHSRCVPSIVKQRVAWIDANGASVETLFLGSSVSYWAVSPELFDAHSYNLSSNGQTIDMSYYILQSQIDKLPNLHRIVLELAYFTFFDDEWERSTDGWFRWIAPTIYYRTTKHSRFSRYGFEMSYLPDFRRKMVSWREQDIVKESPRGHATYRPQHDRLKKWKQSIIWINVDSTLLQGECVPANVEHFNGIFELCAQRNIEVIVVIYPMSQLYRDSVSGDVVAETYRLLHSIQHPYRLLDYSADARFNDDDFFDVLHLNTDVGAVKMTKILRADLSTTN